MRMYSGYNSSNVRWKRPDEQKLNSLKLEWILLCLDFSLRGKGLIKLVLFATNELAVRDERTPSGYTSNKLRRKTPYNKPTSLNYTQVIFTLNFELKGMRERSPPLPKIAHLSLPRLGRSQASTRQSAMPETPPGGTAWLITVSSVPGKLTSNSTALLLYPQSVRNTCGFWLINYLIHSIHSDRSVSICRTMC